MDDGNNLRTTNPQLTDGGAGACRGRMRGDATVDDIVALPTMVRGRGVAGRAHRE